MPIRSPSPSAPTLDDALAIAVACTSNMVISPTRFPTLLQHSKHRFRTTPDVWADKSFTVYEDDGDLTTVFTLYCIDSQDRNVLLGSLHGTSFLPCLC
jgi:hypothetical protein